MNSNRRRKYRFDMLEEVDNNESLLNFDPQSYGKEEPIQTFETVLERTVSNCSTKWLDTSWLGIFTYVLICCLNYPIGRAIYKTMGYHTPEHSNVRIFGDIVTVGWFALGFIALPWHNWEKYTCIRTRDIVGFGRFLIWWAGTLIAYLIYGKMGEDPFFQTSLASTNLSAAQKFAYGVVFGVIGVIVIYWFGKLCPCKPFKRLCSPKIERKVIFIRLVGLLIALFVTSYLLCKADDHCTYHLHHWWFGYSLVLLSTASLDNWFDYFLQGIFWTFVIESLFNYGLVFSEFFI